MGLNLDGKNKDLMLMMLMFSEGLSKDNMMLFMLMMLGENNNDLMLTIMLMKLFEKNQFSKDSYENDL